MFLLWKQSRLLILAAVALLTQANVCLAGGVFVASDSCQTMASRTNQLTLDLVPVSASAGSVTIAGSSITLGGGGVTVELALYVSGWGAVGDGTLVNVSAMVDGVGYCSGSGEPVVPLGYPTRPLFDCAMRAGLGCPVDGNTCDEGAFVSDKICSISKRFCSSLRPCDVVTEGTCIDNPDFVFSGMNPFTAIEYSGLDYIFSTFISNTNGPVDMGQSGLFGTLYIDVPLDAAGTYTIDFDTGIDSVPFSSLTGILDGGFMFHPFEIIHPATIVVGFSSGGNGDFNGDRRVDMLDAQRFQRCYSSAGVMLDTGCHAGDMDNDGDIDLSDYAEFNALIQ